MFSRRVTLQQAMAQVTRYLIPLDWTTLALHWQTLLLVVVRGLMSENLKVGNNLCFL